MKLITKRNPREMKFRVGLNAEKVIKNFTSRVEVDYLRSQNRIKVGLRNNLHGYKSADNPGNSNNSNKGRNK